MARRCGRVVLGNSPFQKMGRCHVEVELFAGLVIAVYVVVLNGLLNGLFKGAN
jgi:hypothetical protein